MSAIIKKYKSLLLADSFRPYLVFGAVALAIMLPLFMPGFILTLDMVFTPKIRMPETINNLYLVEILLYLLNLVISAPVIEKIILFSIFLFSGVGMYKLCEVKNKYGRYFAGLIYTVNPYTYSRLMDGQFVLILGYMLMPFFANSLLKFLRQPELRKSIIVGCLGIAIAMTAIHMIFFMLVFTLVAVIFYAIKNRKNKKYFIKGIKYGIVAVFLFLLANSFWLLPIFKGTDKTFTRVSNFDRRYFVVFQTATDPQFGVLFNTAAMYGHWGDRENRYVLPKTVVPLWYIVAVAFIILAFSGLIMGIKKRNTDGVIFGVVGIFAWFLAVGVAYGPFSSTFYWFVDNVPLFQGFRDSQKFVGLLILAYAFLGGYAVSFIVDKTKDSKFLWFLPELLLILPLVYTPNIFWGFNGQLKPVHYPADWYALNEQLNQDKEDFKVLFLPWHLYQSYPFTGRIIANPSNKFFDKPVIHADAIEIGDIYRQEGSSPDTLLIEERVIKRKNKITDMGRELNPLKIKYIIVAKNFEFESYKFLDTQTDLRAISDTESLKVYINNSFTK